LFSKEVILLFLVALCGVSPSLFYQGCLLQKHAPKSEELFEDGFIILLSAQRVG